DGPGRTLLGVLRQFIFQVPSKCSDKAGRRAHRPAPLQAAEPGTHRAAAGVPSDADVLQIDFLPREQIIECPDAVPGPPGAEKLAHEKLLIAGVQVFADTVAVARLQISTDVLQSFALADRVEDQNDVALPGQPLDKTLVRLDRLAIRRMPTASHDAWQRQLAIG